MFALAKTYKTDPKLETEGIWVPSGTTDDGKEIRFRLRRMGGANKAYEQSIIAGFKPIQSQIKAGIASPEVMERIALKSFVSTVLVGWENVQDSDGNDVPMTLENATALLTELPDLYKDLVAAAGQMALYKAELLKAAAGN